MSLDRYLSVVYPLKAVRLRTKGHGFLKSLKFAFKLNFQVLRFIILLRRAHCACRHAPSV